MVLDIYFSSVDRSVDPKGSNLSNQHFIYDQPGQVVAYETL